MLDPGQKGLKERQSRRRRASADRKSCLSSFTALYGRPPGGLSLRFSSPKSDIQRVVQHGSTAGRPQCGQSSYLLAYCERPDNTNLCPEKLMRSQVYIADTHRLGPAFEAQSLRRKFGLRNSFSYCPPAVQSRISVLGLESQLANIFLTTGSPSLGSTHPQS